MIKFLIKFLPSNPFCKLCEMLNNDNHPQRVHGNLNQWYNKMSHCELRGSQQWSKYRPVWDDEDYMSLRRMQESKTEAITNEIQMNKTQYTKYWVLFICISLVIIGIFHRHLWRLEWFLPQAYNYAKRSS